MKDSCFKFGMDDHLDNVYKIKDILYFIALLAQVASLGNRYNIDTLRKNFSSFFTNNGFSVENIEFFLDTFDRTIEKERFLNLYISPQECANIAEEKYNGICNELNELDMRYKTELQREIYLKINELLKNINRVILPDCAISDDTKLSTFRVNSELIKIFARAIKSIKNIKVREAAEKNLFFTLNNLKFSKENIKSLMGVFFGEFGQARAFRIDILNTGLQNILYERGNVETKIENRFPINISNELEYFFEITYAEHSTEKVNSLNSSLSELNKIMQELSTKNFIKKGAISLSTFPSSNVPTSRLPQIIKGGPKDTKQAIIKNEPKDSKQATTEKLKG